MACTNCTGKKRAVKPTTLPKRTADYIEGEDGFLEVAYKGVRLSVVGRFSYHLYKFEPGAKRRIDKRDAKWFIENIKGFSEVKPKRVYKKKLSEVKSGTESEDTPSISVPANI